VTETDANPQSPSIHVEQTIEAIGRMHAEHRATATRHQRAVDRITSLLDGPIFIAFLTVLVLAWLFLNSVAGRLGLGPLDPPPFPWLSDALSLVSLYLVVLILTTQRRDDRLAQRRELLGLELAILSEQKIAKVIALLEEMRRDSPQIHNRVDEEADSMAQPADPQSVIEATKETRLEPAPVSRPAESG